MLGELPHAADIVRAHAAAFFHAEIDAHGGDADLGHLRGGRRLFVGAHDDEHPVAIAVAGVLSQSQRSPPQLSADKENIKAQVLGTLLEAVEDAGEELVSQALSPAGGIEDPQAVAAPGLQRSRRGVGGVSHLFGHGADPRGGVAADIPGVVERFAHGGDGHSALLGDLPYGNQSAPSPFPATSVL